MIVVIILICCSVIFIISGILFDRHRSRQYLERCFIPGYRIKEYEKIGAGKFTEYRLISESKIVDVDFEYNIVKLISNKGEEMLDSIYQIIKYSDKAEIIDPSDNIIATFKFEL